MEIATFIKIARNKKGKIHGKIQFTNGTTMSIPKGAKINEGLQNQECEVLRKKGVIARIVINGKEIFSSTTPPSSQGKQNHHKSQKGYRQSRPTRRQWPPPDWRFPSPLCPTGGRLTKPRRLQTHCRTPG